MRLQDRLRNGTISYANSWIPLNYELGDFTDYLKLTTEPQLNTESLPKALVSSNDDASHGDLKTDKFDSFELTSKGLIKGSVSSKVIRNRLNNLADNNTTASTEQDDFKIEIDIPCDDGNLEEELINKEELKTSLKLLNISINRNDELTNKRQFLSRSINHLIKSVDSDDKVLIKMIFEQLDESIKYEIMRVYLNDSELVKDFKMLEEERTIGSNSSDDDETIVNDYEYNYNLQHQLIKPATTTAMGSTPELRQLDILIIKLMDLCLILTRLFFKIIMNPIINVFLKEIIQINKKYQVLERFIRIGLDILVSILGHLINLLNTLSTHSNDGGKRMMTTELGYKNKNRNHDREGSKVSGSSLGSSELSLMILRRLLNGSDGGSV